MIIFDTTPLLRPRFTDDEFTPTQHSGAAEKATFANTFCRFVAAGFKPTLFSKAFCRRLSMCFGHIAHYNRDGFYETFFSDLRGKVAFFEQTLTWPCYGDPAWTYSDVERALQQRVRACNLLDAYRALLRTEIEHSERKTLRRLQEKYECRTTVTGPTPILRAPAPARPARDRIPPEQECLF